MKICLIIADKLSKMAGLEKHFIELANGLSKNIEVYVIADSTYFPFLDEKIKKVDINLNSSRYNVITYFKLLNFLKNNYFDIVHTQANKATYIISKIKKFFPRIKFVATLHNKKKKIEYFNKMDCVICVSDFVRKQIENTKTITLYNGLDIEKLKSVTSIDLYKKFDIKNNLPICVSVGRLVEAKGFSFLINIFRDIEANLLIVGDGELLDILKKEAKDYGIEDKIFFLGFRNDVLNIIKSSDLVIIASKYEGFSYVFAETLILEKPLLSSDVADIKKFVPKIGICDIEDANCFKLKIKKILKHSLKDYEEYYKKAEEVFSLKNMIGNTLEVYKELLIDN